MAELAYKILIVKVKINILLYSLRVRATLI